MDRVILFSENAVQRWQHDPENQLFERKSARLAPKDLASHLCAFANASGGTLVIGIEDDGEITGITVSQENAFRQAGIEFLSLLPEYQVFARRVQVEDSSEPKRILVFFIQPSHNIIIKLKTGEAYLRVGDQSRRLSASQLLELEYARGTRSFETTLVPDATLEDLDENLIAEYVRLLDPMASDSTDLLRARGLLRKDGITVAGVLLFAKHPTRFLPAARVRFLRYEGTLTPLEKNLVYYIANVDQCTTKKLMDFTGKSRPTVLRYIRRLSDTGIVKEHAAAVSDPTKYYTLADAYPEEP